VNSEVERPPQFAFAVAVVFLVVIPEGDLLLSLSPLVLFFLVIPQRSGEMCCHLVLFDPTRIATKAVN
jgi:hypothetical protein